MTSAAFTIAIQSVTYSAILAALVWSAYHNVLSSPFLFDDVRIFYKISSSVRQGSRIPLEMVWRTLDNARALTNLSYRVDQGHHGEHPEGWHKTSILIHVLNCSLVFACYSAFISQTGAFVAAAAFAVYPVSTEAVSPIAGRSSLICAVFYFGTLIAFLMGLEWLFPLLAYQTARSKEEGVMILGSLGMFWWFF